MPSRVGLMSLFRAGMEPRPYDNVILSDSEESHFEIPRHDVPRNDRGMLNNNLSHKKVRVQVYIYKRFRRSYAPRTEC